MDASELYDTDFVLWTAQQAAELRRLTGASNSLDVLRLAEEIEDLGRRDVREVESYLQNIFVHVVKIVLASTSSYVPHWRSEIVAFQRNASRAFAPSMRQLINANDEWLAAVRVVASERSKAVRSRMDAVAANQGCPVTLDDVLAPGFDIDAFLERFASTLAEFRTDP